MTTISSTDCRRLRELAKLRGSIIAVSNETKYEYHSILNHVRGRCNHTEIDIDPLPQTEERHGTFSEHECGKMRDLYFEDRYTLSKVAEEFDCSKRTVFRHVRYRCSHYLPTDEAWGSNTTQSVGSGSTDPDWPDKSASESLTEVTTRNYPSRFREVAISKFNGQGLVSGIRDPRLLEVAHILSWSKYPDHRFDPGNVLVLSKLHHAAFDSHLFTFSTDHRIHIKPEFETDNPLLVSGLLEHENDAIDPPHDELMDREYIAERNEDIEWYPP